MARIKRLFPCRNIPSTDEVEGYSLRANVRSAKGFSEEVLDLQAILPFDEEIQKKVDMPLLLRDLLRFMLVVVLR